MLPPLAKRSTGRPRKKRIKNCLGKGGIRGNNLFNLEARTDARDVGSWDTGKVDVH